MACEAPGQGSNIQNAKRFCINTLTLSYQSVTRCIHKGSQFRLPFFFGRRPILLLGCRGKGKPSRMADRAGRSTHPTLICSRKGRKLELAPTEDGNGQKVLPEVLINIARVFLAAPQRTRKIKCTRKRILS